MSLWQDVATTRMAIKHTPDAVDLGDVRDLLGRVDDALTALYSLTSGADISFTGVDHDWAVTVSTVISDRGPIFRWMADR